MVKAVLKRNNVMLSEFAQSLNVSRPTLDTYIKNYDDGGRLSNTLFQKIFDFLFGDVRMSNAEFAKRYAYVKEHYGKRVGASIAVMQDRSIYPLLRFANEESNGALYSRAEYEMIVELIAKRSPVLLRLIKLALLDAGKVQPNECAEPERASLLALQSIEDGIKYGAVAYDEGRWADFALELDKKHGRYKDPVEEKRRALEQISATFSALVNNTPGLTLDDIVEALRAGSTNGGKNEEQNA